MKINKKVIKSANEDLFELDEQAINEISNAEEFADVEITNEDIMDAIQAIDAVADAVIEKADAEEKEVDADAVLEQVTEILEKLVEDEQPTEEEITEAEIPEEIANSVVRVMVSEDGEVEVEQKPDEIYEAEVDGLNTTVFDTTEECPVENLEDTADAEKVEDDVLIIGNSAAKSFRKGYMTVKSSTNKKAWSNAFKKVKKMVGSSKLKAAHWVIVSALAKKEEEEEKLQKNIQCALVKYIKNNAEKKAAFMQFIKSDVAGQDVQPELNQEGVTDVKPENQAGENNPGFGEENNPANGQEGNPEGVISEFGNPTQNPDKQVQNEDEVALPEAEIVVVEVPLTNSVRKIQLKKVHSSVARKYNLYKVMSSKDVSYLDGRVIKSGNIAYAFRDTAHGMLACCAKFVDNGKGNYKPVLSGKNVVITKGVLAPVFSNYEKIQNVKRIVSNNLWSDDDYVNKLVAVYSTLFSLRDSYPVGDIKEELSTIINELFNLIEKLIHKKEHEQTNDIYVASSRRSIKSAADNDRVYSYGFDYIINSDIDVQKAEDIILGQLNSINEIELVGNPGINNESWSKEEYGISSAKKPVTSARQSMTEERKQAIKSAIMTRRAERSEQQAIQSKIDLEEKFQAEERQRLFQSSQTQINEEKIAIKSNNARNAAALDKLYNGMF